MVTIGDWVFAIAGCSLIWVSVFRFGFGESFASMPRSVFILAGEILILGILMILMGIKALKLSRLMNILRLFLGKGLYCIFAAGFMDVSLYTYSNIVTIITFSIFVLGCAYLLLAIIFITKEIDEISNCR